MIYSTNDNIKGEHPNIVLEKVKTTPKKLAQEIIYNALQSAYYWNEKIDNDKVEAMTEKEFSEVNKQIGKITGRLEKLLK